MVFFIVFRALFADTKVNSSGSMVTAGGSPLSAMLGTRSVFLDLGIFE